MEDILEKKLKQDLQSLLALGTKKFLSRSLNCFGGMLKSLIMGETVNMWKKGKKGQYAASFVRSLYESKRCWFKMSNALLRENEQKHCQMLCGEKKEIDEIAKSYIEKATDYIFPSEEMERTR